MNGLPVRRCCYEMTLQAPQAYGKPQKHTSSRTNIVWNCFFSLQSHAVGVRNGCNPDAYVSLFHPRTAASTYCGRDQLWDAVLTAVAVVLFLHVQENDGSTRWTETGVLNAPSSLLWIGPACLEVAGCDCDVGVVSCVLDETDFIQHACRHVLRPPCHE